MAPERTLEQTLAEARARGLASPSFRPRPPVSWSELHMDRRVRLLQVLLALHLFTLSLFWACYTGLLDGRPQTLLLTGTGVLFSLGLLSYVSAKVQNGLQAIGFAPHGAARLWIGIVILNPLFLAWYAPASVAFRAWRAQRAMRAARAAPPRSSAQAD